MIPGKTILSLDYKFPCRMNPYRNLSRVTKFHAVAMIHSDVNTKRLAGEACGSPPLQS